MRKRIDLLVALSAFGLCLAAGASDAEACRLQVLKAAQPFVIDGDTLEQAYVEASWSKAFTVLEPESKEVNGLYLAVEPRFLKAETRVGAFFDKENVTFCFLAPCPADVPAQDGDSVECHLMMDGKTVYRMAVDLTGRVTYGKYDAMTLKDEVWSADGAAAVKRGTKSFSVELRLPFAAFGGKVRPKGVWRCNFIRRGASCGGMSSWAPTNREQMDPGKFGRLVFEGTAEEKPAEPRPENIGQRIFLWGDDPWSDNAPSVAAPLDRKELARLDLEGFRGTRAVGAFRVSNLTDRHALFNLCFASKDKDLSSRVRIREEGYLELRGGEVIPDPIFDLPIGSVLRVPPKSTAIVWVDVDCTGLTPGKHAGTLKLVPGYSGFDEKAMKLVLEVGKPDLGEVKMPVWYYSLGHRNQAAASTIVRDYGFNVFTLAPHVHYCPPNKDGNFDFSALDEKIAALVAAGVPKDELRLMLYSMFPNWAGFTTADGRRLKFLEPEWKAEYGKRLRAVIAHLREKHGIGYDRVFLSTNDEPKGDPDDPKSKAYAAFKGAEFVRSVDPKLRLFCNPWALEPDYLQRYLDTFDILEPYLRRFLNGTEDPAVAKRFAESGKEIWSYTIYVKQNTVHQYRRVFWGNMDYGWEGPAAVYGFAAETGDPFNSYDTGKGGKSYSDYNSGYRNDRTGQQTPSRRLEAWYQGLVDMKLVKWCHARLAERKAKGEDVSAAEDELKAIIHEANAPRSDFGIARRRIAEIARGL